MEGKQRNRKKKYNLSDMSDEQVQNFMDMVNTDDEDEGDFSGDDYYDDPDYVPDDYISDCINEMNAKNDSTFIIDVLNMSLNLQSNMILSYCQRIFRQLMPKKSHHHQQKKPNQGRLIQPSSGGFSGSGIYYWPFSVGRKTIEIP